MRGRPCERGLGHHGEDRENKGCGEAFWLWEERKSCVYSKKEIALKMYNIEFKSYNVRWQRWVCLF